MHILDVSAVTCMYMASPAAWGIIASCIEYGVMILTVVVVVFCRELKAYPWMNRKGLYGALRRPDSAFRMCHGISCSTL